jgi:hypothetical protein
MLVPITPGSQVLRAANMMITSLQQQECNSSENAKLGQNATAIIASTLQHASIAALAA